MKMDELIIDNVRVIDTIEKAIEYIQELEAELHELKKHNQPLTNIVTNGDFSNKKVKLDDKHYAEQTITGWNTCVWEIKKVGNSNE